MKKTLMYYEKRVRRLLAQGLVSESTVCCFNIDRSENGKWGKDILIDRAPTLTTKNRYIWVLKAGDVRRPYASRQCCRLESKHITPARTARDQSGQRRRRRRRRNGS